MTKAEINLAKTQLREDTQILLGDLQRLCLGQADASEHLGHGHSPASRNAECAGEAGVSAEGSLFMPHQLSGQSAECMRETVAAVPNEDSLFLPFQPSIDSGYASNVATQQVCGTTPVASSPGSILSEIEGGGELLRAASGQKRSQVVDSATSKRHRPSAAEATDISATGVEPLNADDIAATTNASTDPPRDEDLQELAGTEDIPDFSVGSGMALDDLGEFWTGNGMDLNNVNLATPTGFPNFLIAEQPCESPRPVAGSENEHQAE